MTPLHSLASAAGLQIHWNDAAGTPQSVGDDTLIAVLAAMDLPAQSNAEIADSIDAMRTRKANAAFLSADIGAPVALPDSIVADTAEVLFENGETSSMQLVRKDGHTWLPALEQVGYHRLVVGTHALCLAIAPRRCVSVGDVAGRRIWGPAVQIPALRDERDTAFGDFGALAQAARASGTAGADALAISPIHALFPADPGRYSPYAPSSRLFTNILLGDPGDVGQPLPSAPVNDLIDWRSAIPRKVAQLRQAFANRPPSLDAELSRFREERGTDLVRHATFDVLHAHFFDDGARGWRDWPSAFHDPSSAPVAEFAGRHREEIDFYIFAQWLAEQSLDTAQSAAKSAGMAVGLIADLAIGMDPGGSQVWSRPDDLLTGLTIGAPPDLLGPDGQNWGITGFSPQALKRTGFDGFIATLRAALDHAGGIRIDHALGLNRLWVIPEGGSAAEGAYLKYPQDDMLRILAIESYRADAIVIGEDLGTVPEGLRPRLEDKAIAGMRVLWFERDKSGEFAPPGAYDRAAAAMTGTHDLPTVAGWWKGRDLDWNDKLGRDGPDDRADRAADRTRLWHAFTASGATSAAEPPPEEPASAVTAAVLFVAGTESEIVILPMEDLVGLDEQPNLPGTIAEHPNWRRRMPGTTEAMFTAPEISTRLSGIDTARKS